ncbi:hypothetical protein G7Y89_g9307 [Cudoniella acicularis]|uniref:DUF6604 domain-containing protein n=1 Tax=Cudoniella acicularis TaxID=354080 RepID=A0A8H4REX8_9HELO|nr:hypothetical protein G7Y89_g9307 [Cudoniella acicularis]
MVKGNFWTKKRISQTTFKHVFHVELSTFVETEKSVSAALNKENRGHDYFIEVLVAVLDTLKPKFEAVETLPNQKPPRLKSKSNIFELLKVEDCAEVDDVGLSDLKLYPWKLMVRPKKTTSQQKPSDPETGWNFKAYCPFTYFNSIRKHVENLWIGYRDGQVDLITASMITEVAFHAMENIERETLFSTLDGF